MYTIFLRETTIKEQKWQNGMEMRESSMKERCEYEKERIFKWNYIEKKIDDGMRGKITRVNERQSVYVEGEGMTMAI